MCSRVPAYSSGLRTSTSWPRLCMCASTSSRNARMLRVLALRRLVARRRVARHLARQRPILLLPFQPAAVHDLGVGVAEQLEHPEGVARPPVVPVAVEDDRGVAGDADARHQRVEGVASDVIAPHLVVEVAGPVDVHGAGEVPGGVEQRVFVRLDDADVRDRAGARRPSRSRRARRDGRSCGR